jgi:hypothetical protein
MGCNTIPTIVESDHQTQCQNQSSKIFYTQLIIIDPSAIMMTAAQTLLNQEQHLPLQQEVNLS